MAIIQVDTALLKDSGEQVMKLAQEYQNIIQNFYKRIEQIPMKDEWIGSENGENKSDTSVYQFTKKALTEIPNYQDFGSSIELCGREMIQYANDLELVMQKNQIG